MSIKSVEEWKFDFLIPSPYLNRKDHPSEGKTK